jgi:hypothetical protein
MQTHAGAGLDYKGLHVTILNLWQVLHIIVELSLGGAESRRQQRRAAR